MTARSRLAAYAAVATALTSSAMGAVYSDYGWLLPTLAAIAAVYVGVEVAARLTARLLFGWFWRLAGGAAALLVFACALDARDKAWGGFVPTPSAVTELRSLLGEAFDDIHTLAAPVPTHTGLVLLTLLGVGGVALVVDLLSPRAPLVGLPLLALYSVPEWLSPHGTGPVPFILGAAGYLALLTREGRERTMRWGRTISGVANAPIGTRAAALTPAGAVNAAGRRIGVLAVAVALVVPPLVPGLDQPHLFGLGNGLGGGNGKGPVVTYNPITKIYGDLNRGAVEPLLSYRTNTKQGAYLEFSTLDRYNLVGWSQSDLTGAGPARDGMTAPELPPSTTKLHVQVQVSDDLNIQWLPLPADTLKVTGVSDQWVYDARSHTVFSPHSNTRDISYAAEAAIPDPSQQQLETSPPVDVATSPALQSYLTLPAGISPRVQALAEAITKNYTSPYLKAWALQYYFTDSGGFIYDTHSPQGNGIDALENFVMHTKRGYCEQFATAMAAMARMIGIPARVAVGFTPGTRHGNEFVVTTEDAHAWPELYFTGLGWLRFEPTPRGTGGAVTPAYAQGAPTLPNAGKNAGGNSTGTPGGTTDAGGSRSLPHGLSRLEPVLPSSGHVAPINQKHHGAPLSARTLAAIALACAVLLGLLAVPITAWWVRRRRHVRAVTAKERAHAAWLEILTIATDVGLRVPASDSPRGAARRLARIAHLGSTPADALDRLARVEERARYARTLPDGDGLAERLGADVHVVRRALLSGASRRTRLRARLLPPSAVAAATEAVSGGFERSFDRLDGWVGGAMRRLPGATRRTAVRSTRGPANRRG